MTSPLPLFRPLLRPLLIVIVGLLVCSSATPAASAGTRPATSLGGSTATVAVAAPDGPIGIASRIRNGARVRSHQVAVRHRAPTRRASRRATHLSHRVVKRVNRLRRKGIRCAGDWQPRVRRVRYSNKLARAARTYARRMAVLRFFSHTDKLTGKRSGWRASRVGYRWATVGENLAAGYASPAAVIRAWRRSPSHCRNMMDRRWRHLGVGWFHGRRSRWGSYWTQLFGNPR